MEWRKIPGIDIEYEASDEGQIRSYKIWRGVAGPRILIGAINKVTGYPFVQVMENGKLKVKTIHRLVALAFIPNPLNLPEVNHIDSNRTNNRLENLEWVSRTQNAHHAVISGGYRTGNRGQRTKITDEQVQEIRRLVLVDGRTQASVARDFKIGGAIVGLYINGYRCGSTHIPTQQVRDEMRARSKRIKH